MAGISLRRSSSLRRRHNRAAFRAGLIIIATFFTQTTAIATGDATVGHFSQKQISSYIQTVTSELQLSKNWQTNFGTSASGSLYCASSLLGEGVRAGVRGLYTWFTCSAMHKLDLNAQSKDSISCTGFSSAVWIQPGLKSITYQAITSDSDFAQFRANAPAVIQNQLDASYNQVNQKSTRVIIGRAISGASTSSTSPSQPTLCQ